MIDTPNGLFDEAKKGIDKNLIETTILVIDDQIAGLRGILDHLADYGFTILVAEDGQSGLERARYTRPDIILLDVRMPGLDGFEVCRRLKADESTDQVPVIFMTSLTEIEDKVAGFEAGGVDYITKPLQPEEVLARLNTHLVLHRLQQQLETQNAQLQQEIAQRKRIEKVLQQAQMELEQRVEARTLELKQTNEQLIEEIKERKRAEAETGQRNRELALLNQVIAASVVETEAEAILEITCRELALTFDAPQATAALLNPEKTEAVTVAEYRLPDRPSVLGAIIPAADNPAFQYLLDHKMPLAVDDAQNDPRLSAVHDLVKRRGIVSLLLVPLTIKGEVIGSLGLDAIEPRRFSTEEIGLAWSVANQVSGVLARLQLDQERQRLEQQYHQAKKLEAVGRLTGGVAHDFNNILTVIISNCNIILIDLDQDHPLRPDIEQIHEAAKRAAALTYQLLAFSRQQILQPKIVNLNDIVINIGKMLRRLIAENINLATMLDPLLGQVKADPGQLEQVIVNLVVNSCDAMPEGGKVIIETAGVNLDEMYARQHVGVAAGPYVMLAVSDTGPGIDADTQAHIFEPFFTTKGQGQGTGLGLATVHGIVNQSGGHIWVYSEPEYGTTFKVYLPRIETNAELTESSRQASTKSGQGSETILLVEDEDMVRKLAHRILLKQGYTVLVAREGKQAHQLCITHQGPIHLLLTDVIIPGDMSGFQLAQKLVSLRPEMKVLYMSGYTNNVIVHHGVLDASIAFLPKPFALDDLICKVRDVLDKETSSL